MRFILDDLDREAERVSNIEAQVAGLVLGYRLGDLDANGSQVGAHAARIVGFEANIMEKAVVLGIFSNEFDELMVIDLDEYQVLGPVWVLQGKGLFEAEKVFIVGAGFAQVTHIVGNMRNAKNTWMLYFPCGPNRHNQTR